LCVHPAAPHLEGSFDIKHTAPCCADMQLGAASRAIAEWAGAEVVPARYGGASERPLGECPLEVELAAYVAALAARR
jgi:hypothetical protein